MPFPPTDPSLPLPSLCWGLAGLRATSAGGVRWLWHGYLAAGAVTLLTSQWKTGKTTLTAVLLARLKAGGLLAGRAVTPGRAVVLSEESAEHWVLRGGKLDLEEHVAWCCRPFSGRPSPAAWQALLERVGDEPGVGLVVIDPLATFYPGGSENNAGTMLAALAPVRALAARGPAVLVLHHPSRKDRGDGPAGRGSGALLGSADILIELRWYRRSADTDRRRRLVALSRYDDTPRDLVIELNAAGTDYLAHGGLAEEEFADRWRLLEGILAPAHGKLTRADLLERWPGDEPPDPTTMHRWLRRAIADGRLRRDGRGTRGQPFRYWLPETEERWRRDPMAVVFIPELFLPPLGEGLDNR